MSTATMTRVLRRTLPLLGDNDTEKKTDLPYLLEKSDDQDSWDVLLQ